jgi:hypothetical protein
LNKITRSPAAKPDDGAAVVDDLAAGDQYAHARGDY